MFQKYEVDHVSIDTLQNKKYIYRGLPKKSKKLRTFGLIKKNINKINT